MLSDNIKKKIEELGELILDYIYEQDDVLKKIKALRRLGIHISITIDAFEDFEEISEALANFNSSDHEFLKKIKIKFPDDSN